MGIFDFLKPKTSEASMDINLLFLQELKESIKERGYSVEYSTEYAAIIVKSEIEIASAIVPGDFHPYILPLMSMTIHKDFFPNGIQSTLMGVGNSNKEKVKSAVKNYLSSVFDTVIESFSDHHQGEIDFTSYAAGREILWHPKMSVNSFQGTWKETNDQINLYSIVENELKEKLLDTKFNWLKLYIARQPDGELSGECLLNNQVWIDGYSLLEAYAKTWKDDGQFLGHKQFIMFRRCDSYD